MFKSGYNLDLAYYLPISLAASISKILERVIGKDITNFMGENVRSVHSMISQLLSHKDSIWDSMEQGKNIYIVYLDFKKTYDKGDIWTLIQKLTKIGKTEKLGKSSYSPNK